MQRIRFIYVNVRILTYIILVYPILSYIIPCSAWGMTPYFFLRVTPYFFLGVTPYFFLGVTQYFFLRGTPYSFFQGPVGGLPKERSMGLPPEKSMGLPQTFKSDFLWGYPCKKYGCWLGGYHQGSLMAVARHCHGTAMALPWQCQGTAPWQCHVSAGHCQGTAIRANLLRGPGVPQGRHCHGSPVAMAVP